jgi:hypothetical protein
VGRVLFGLLEGGPPVLQQSQGGGRLAVGGHHPVMGLVGSDGFLNQSGSDQLEGFAFPGLLLPPVLSQLRGAEAKPQGAEAAAGIDRRQLPIIADQHDLGLGLVGVVEEAGELAAADHAGLIDHQDGAGVQLLAAAVQVAEEAVAGGHVLEPLALQAHGGDPGRGRAQEPVAVQLPGMAGDAQGEGLARPGPPDHQGDPLAALTDIPDHRLLVCPGGRMRRQSIADRLVGDPRRLLPGPTGSGDDQLLLDAKEVWGGPAALLQGPVGDHADRPLSQEPIRQLLQFRPFGPSEAGAQGDQDVGAAEGGRVLGQPVRAGQPIEQLTGRRFGHRKVLGAVGCPAGHRPDQSVRVHPALGRLCPPSVVQGVRGLVLLGFAGRLDGPLDQPRCPLPTVRGQPVELDVELVGALGEATDQRLGYPLELSVAMGVRWRPLDPEGPDEFPLVGGSVDGVRSQPMPVEIPSVQRRPASIRPLDTVGDDQVRVQQRVAFSGGPVVEPDREQPLSGHVLDTTVAAASSQVAVQVGNRLGQPSVMGGQHRPAGRSIPEAVENRHALGRPQHYIKGRHAVTAMRPAEQLPSCRVPALEHGLEPGRRCFALQPQAAGAGAIPPAWGLPVSRQILLVVGGQLAGVVLLPPHREFGDVGHHPAAPPRRRWRERTHPWCIALLGSDEWRVDRAAKLHPL